MKILFFSLFLVLPCALLAQTTNSVLTNRLLSAKNIDEFRHAMDYQFDIQINDNYNQVIMNLKKQGIDKYDISVDNNFTSIFIDVSGAIPSLALIFFNNKLIFYFDSLAGFSEEYVSKKIPVFPNCKYLTVTYNSDYDPPKPLRTQLQPLECSPISKTICYNDKYYINFFGGTCCSYCGSLCFLNYDYLGVIVEKYPIIRKMGLFYKTDWYIDEIKKTKEVFEQIPNAEEIFIVY